MNREEVIAIYEEEVQDATAAKANAHLIAAAPDMYAALAQVIDAFDTGTLGSEALHVARAALAKARGEV